MSVQELFRTKAVKPAAAQAALLRVVRREAVSPSFVRVTLTGADDVLDRTFAAMGYDQWFRLFLPAQPGTPPVLPDGGLERWYTRWLALDEKTRAVIRNYTVRDARPSASGGWEIDVDFVIHRNGSTREVEGVAARWAVQAQPGDLAGMLDQGTLYSSGPVSGASVIVADETGLPAAEGIARSLPARTHAVFVLEVPCEEDQRLLPSAANVDVRWAVREADSRPGGAALALLTDIDLQPDDYVYAVGEGSFALEARTWAQDAGVPKHLVDFCAYWRSERRARRRQRLRVG